MDSVNGAGASRLGSETEGSRWHCHYSGFDYLVRANDRKVLHQVDEMGCKHM